VLRYCISSTFIFLAACGGASTETPMVQPKPAIVPKTPEDVPPIPVTFVANAFDAGFGDIKFADRQAWRDEALDVAQGLEASNLETLGAAGEATYNGLIQLDYNGYVDDRRDETYVVASALGKLSLSVAFSEANDTSFVSFEGTADSFVRNDDTPLEGSYELYWVGPITTDDPQGHSEDFVIYMDGRLSAGDTNYSGDANMYLDATGENAAYLNGAVNGELQIWDIKSPLVGSIYGNTTGTVVANRN